VRPYRNQAVRLTTGDEMAKMQQTKTVNRCEACDEKKALNADGLCKRCARWAKASVPKDPKTAYRFIGVSLVSVDKHGATRCDRDWVINIKEGRTIRFSLQKGEPEGLENVLQRVSDELIRIV
jgi:hypothetical protein